MIDQIKVSSAPKEIEFTWKIMPSLGKMEKNQLNCHIFSTSSIYEENKAFHIKEPIYH